MSSEGLLQIGTLEGHAGGVTALSGRTFTNDADNRVFQLITASRDKTIMLWNIERRGDVASDGQTSVKIVGTPAKSLHGHSHFVSCIDVSNDGQFALSGSWDGTLRLWNLKTGLTTKRFIGHKKDVLSVAFSGGNRQIVSASRDRSIKLWNTRGECKYTLTEEGHTDWVSCVRFSPDEINPTIVSCGWDKMVKVWNVTNCKLKCNLVGHKFYLNTVTVSPDGSLCGSGGKDGVAVLWDLNDGKRLYELDAGDIIHDLVFSPNRYWLCAATESCIKIWDLETKHEVDNLVPTFDKLGAKSIPPHCTSLEWADEGTTLYAGYTDGKVRVWEVSMLS